jgi:hypothetical protein
MERLDSRAADRINGPAWTSLRAQFEAIHSILINVSPHVSGVLTTIYVKYTAPELGQTPFAVVWIKKASEIVVGLALPLDFTSPELSETPSGFKYAGLTGFFRVKAAGSVPEEFAEWATAAFNHTKAQCRV